MTNPPTGLRTMVLFIPRSTRPWPSTTNMSRLRVAVKRESRPRRRRSLRRRHKRRSCSHKQPWLGASCWSQLGGHVYEPLSSHCFLPAGTVDLSQRVRKSYDDTGFPPTMSGAISIFAFLPPLHHLLQLSQTFLLMLLVDLRSTWNPPLTSRTYPTTTLCMYR